MSTTAELRGIEPAEFLRVGHDLVREGGPLWRSWGEWLDAVRSWCATRPDDPAHIRLVVRLPALRETIVSHYLRGAPPTVDAVDALRAAVESKARTPAGVRSVYGQEIAGTDPLAALVIASMTDVATRLAALTGETARAVGGKLILASTDEIVVTIPEDDEAPLRAILGEDVAGAGLLVPMIVEVTRGV